MKLQLPALLLLGASIAASAAEPQVGSEANDPNYKLVWQDLFDGTQLNRSRWNVEVNGDGGGNNELQYYIDSPETVRVGDDGRGNGCLILTAIRQSYGGKSFVSGRVNSRDLIKFTHGKIEASIKLPKTANGLWPAFWMMGNDWGTVGWPKCGEIDICEFGNAEGIKNGTQDRFFNGACHWGQGWPAPSYARSITNSYSVEDGEFHLFTCIWDDQSVAMYLDLDKYPNVQPYYKMDIPDNKPDDVNYPGNYFHKLNFILFNLAVGGDFTGIHNPSQITALNDGNGQRQSMYINYVRIYQKGVAGEEQSFNDPGDMGMSGVGTIGGDDVQGIVVVSDRVTLPAAGEIEVFDIAGRLVASAQGTELSLESLDAGCFVVRATVAGHAPATFKIKR